MLKSDVDGRMTATQAECASPIWPARPSATRNATCRGRTVKRIAQIRVNPAAPNPFVIGTEGVVHTLTVAGECARANRLRFEMQPCPFDRADA